MEDLWRLHLVPTSGKGQPALGIHESSGADRRWNAHSIHVITLENGAISAMTLFLDPHLIHDFALLQFPLDDAIAGLRNLSHNL
jgi:RNA polymerase sigma-70 factor (ECF subfamily)